MYKVKSLILASTVALATACCSNNDKKQCAAESSCCGSSTECSQTKTTMKYTKKYTNADFYTDGKFNQEVAKEAYLDMFKHYGVPYTDFMKTDMWVTDFGLGDFENVGMGGIFWVNDAEHAYFGHEIYLLPSQMIPEHYHMPTPGHPAKFESWMVRNGSCYNFSVVGDATPNPPALPATQAPTIKSKNFVVMEVGDIAHLKETETAHFLMATDEGAIVSEFANYHDGAGLGFTNPEAKL